MSAGGHERKSIVVRHVRFGLISGRTADIARGQLRADFVAKVGDVGREFLAAALIKRTPIGRLAAF
jgi:hypothetical protein